MSNPSPRAALAVPSSFATTPSDPNGSPASLRFRERVRTRIGTAELLAFRIGPERFAFDVRALDEALEAPVIEPLPVVAGGILSGIMRVADRSIPVFDTARLLGVRGDEGSGHVLVMRSGARRIGLRVDDVEDVITIDLGTIKPPPFDAGDELLLGVTWEQDVLTAILDARTLITTCQARAGEAAS